MRKNSQAAQKGPDARRRPRAAREAYLYVERAAEGAKFLGGGLRPPSETSPQDSLRRQSRRSKVEHSCLIGDDMWLERPEPYRRRLGVPLRARASPAPRKGEDSEGAVEAP